MFTNNQETNHSFINNINNYLLRGTCQYQNLKLNVSLIVKIYITNVFWKLQILYFFIFFVGCRYLSVFVDFWNIGIASFHGRRLVFFEPKKLFLYVKNSFFDIFYCCFFFCLFCFTYTLIFLKFQCLLF